MKKIVRGLVLSIVVLMVVFNCAVPSTPTRATFSGGEYQPIDSDIDITGARAIAENHLIETAAVDDIWKGAILSDYFVWYNPMVKDKPAYIEYKVSKNGNPQGYIMVSTTKLDYDIPEYSTKGCTMFETLQVESGMNNIKATRFNAFDYMAEGISARNNNQKYFMGDISYLNEVNNRQISAKYNDYLVQYVNSRKKIGGIGDSKKSLDHYYSSKSKAEENKSRSASPPYKPKIHWQLSSVYLIPTWHHYSKSGSFNDSGCCPTSAAMILAYWYLKHGKTGLFSSKPKTYWSDGMMSNEKKVIEGLRNYIGTNSAGYTSAYDTWNGFWSYVWDHGYWNWIIRRYYVDQNSDEGQYYWVNCTSAWDDIYNDLVADRPSLLEYYERDHYPRNGGHAAVIYACTLNRDAWTGTGYSVEYSIMTNWDGTSGNPMYKTVTSGSWTFYEVVTVRIDGAR